MKTKTKDSSPSLGLQAHELVKTLAKGKHGRDFNTLYACCHPDSRREFTTYPVIAPHAIMKRVHEKGYKRYLEDHWITTRDGKKVHVTTQWTFDGFAKFKRYVAKLK